MKNYRCMYINEICAWSLASLTSQTTNLYSIVIKMEVWLARLDGPV